MFRPSARSMGLLCLLLTSARSSHPLSVQVALKQTDRPPRVMHKTFTLISAAYTPMPSAQVSDFRETSLLIRHDCLNAIPVRRTSVLPAASSRSHLAMDTLAVRLTVPLAGPVGDFHPQVLRHAWRTGLNASRSAFLSAHSRYGLFLLLFVADPFQKASILLATHNF